MNGLPATKTTVDRKGLLSFLLITFAITYAIEGALILGGFRIVRGERALGQYVILAVMWVPALATVLTVRFVTREGFEIANVRVGSWRPYVAVGLSIPCCFVLIYALTWMLGLGQPDWSLHDFQRLVAGGSSAKVPPMPSPAVILLGLYAATLLFAPFVNGLFGFGEELGWRGYLLPKFLPLGRRSGRRRPGAGPARAADGARRRGRRGFRGCPLRAARAGFRARASPPPQARRYRPQTLHCP